jgi:transcriptional regulator with XRE-family HTH domain
MADTNSLLQQVASRARKLHDQTGISQSRMAAAIGMASGNYSAFLNGNRGIGAAATCLLLKYTNMPRAKAVAAFSKPIRSGRIMELQEQGRKIRLDDSGGSWVPGLSGRDINDDGNSIDDPDDDTLDSLQRARAIHVKAINAIDKYIAVKAQVNRDGPTAPNSQRFSRAKGYV